MSEQIENQILYHYTDFCALDGILYQKELRANNVLNMNDAEEMALFMKGIFLAVYNRLIDGGEPQKAGDFKELFTDISRKSFEYSAYAVCFSTYRDDASQWERYANRGRGVCLGFRKDILENVVTSAGALSLQTVYYQDDVESHPLVEDIYKHVLECSTISMDTPGLGDSIKDALRNSASFKHPSFSSEHEIRLVLMPFDGPDMRVQPRYHVSKDRIKKYYPLDLRLMCSWAHVGIDELVTEIIIGPESTQSIPILQDYLVDLSLDKMAAHVTHSNCPLRSKIV